VKEQCGLVVAGLELQVAGQVVVGGEELLPRLAAVVDHLLDLLRLGPGFLVLAHPGEDPAAAVTQPAQPDLLLVLGERAAGDALVPALVGFHRLLQPAVLQVDAVRVRPNELSLIIGGNSGGISYDVKREQSPQETHLWIGSSRHKAEVRDPRSLQGRRSAGGEGEGTKKILAAMPGKVVRVLVKERDPVEAGQGVVVVEAMKMQNELKSPKQGAVQKILVAEGASVNAGDVLLLIE